MLADAALMFGWSPDECLRMKCRTFFRVLKEGRKNREVLQIKQCLEFIGVAVCANSDGEYITKLREYYFQRLREVELGDDYKRPSPFMLEADSPEAGRQLLALAKLKMRTLGLH